MKAQFKQKENIFSQKIKQDTVEINNLKTILLKYSQLNSPKSLIDSNQITKMNDQLNSTVQILSKKYKTLKNDSKIKIKELIQQNKEKEEKIQSLKEKIIQIKYKFQSLTEEKINNQYKNLFIQSQNLLEIKETKIQSLKDEIFKLKIKQVKN